MRASQSTRTSDCGRAAAFGALISPVPAKAYPLLPLAPNDCTAYQFPGGTVTLHYPNIGETVFDTALPSAHVDTKASTNYPNGSSMQGSVTGDINGREIHMTVTRARYTPLVLEGTIGDDNRGHGRLTFRDNEPGTWDSLQEFKCVATAAPPATQQKVATVVGGPVDIYNIAHDENPEPATGIQGAKIGTLQDGQQIPLAEGGPCQQGSWCKIVMSANPERFGFVNGHLQF
jgi:hypothetical protein